MAITFEQFMRSLAVQESNNDPTIVNSRKGALGKYQVMPQNLTASWDGKVRPNAGWDYEALGRDVTKEEFLNNPQIQERIAIHQLKKQFDAHGPEKAAMWWYSGSTNPKNIDKRPAKNEPTPREYAASVVRRAGGQPSAPLLTPATSQQTQPAPMQNPWAGLLGNVSPIGNQATPSSATSLPVVNMGNQLAVPENKLEQELFSGIIGAGISPQLEPIYATAAAALAKAKQMQSSVNLLPSNPLEVALSSLFDTVDITGGDNG